MKRPNSIRLVLLAVAALFTHAAFAAKPAPPSPPPPSSGTVVLDYSGLEGAAAENFSLTVVPSGTLYASGVSYDSAWHGIVIGSGDGGNSWSLVDQFPPPGRSLWFWDIAGGITSDAAGNLYVAGLTYDDAVQAAPDQWYVRRSADGGATWNVVDDFIPGLPPLSSGDVTGVAADAAGNVFIAGMAGDAYNWAWTIRKGAGGASFSTVDVVPNSWVTAIFAHPTRGIFAVGTRNINGIPAWLVRRSTNGGATWSDVNAFQLQSGLNSTPLGMGADNAGNLYVVGRGGTSPRRNTVVSHWLVRKSTDGGNSWSNVDDFVPDSNPAEARCFATTTNGDLYVAGIVAGHWVIRKSAGGTGAWTTVDDYQYAGSYAAPHAMAADASGHLFVGGVGVANTGNHWLIKRY